MREVRFTPNSDIDCVFRHVRFGPKADITRFIRSIRQALVPVRPCIALYFEVCVQICVQQFGRRRRSALARLTVHFAGTATHRPERGPLVLAVCCSPENRGTAACGMAAALVRTTESFGDLWERVFPPEVRPEKMARLVHL